MRRLGRWIGYALALLTGFGLLARYVSPDIIWPPAIVALLLPGLLLVTGLFLAYQLYRRRWAAAALPGLVMIIALPTLSKLFAVALGGAAEPSADAESLTVVTANVRGFKDDAWKSLPESTVRNSIEAFGADLLLLQEAGRPRGAASRSEAVKVAGDYASRLHPQEKTLATFGNHPMETVAIHFEGYNGFTVTDHRTPVGKLRVINVHLQSNRITRMAGELRQDSTIEAGANRLQAMFRSYGNAARTRARQAAEILAYVEESPHPVIVAGDFNDVPSSYTYQRIRTPRLQDAWVERGFGLGTTFTGPLPGLRIDFVLADTSLSVRSIERLSEGYSDHRPLKVVLEKAGDE
nr:endonuclease/exonuclease/phosphatase family protein [Lewinella sp. W8]